MRTDDLRKIILTIFRNKKFYGYEVYRILALQNTEINISRLYGVLNTMERDGLLNARWERSSSGPRKKTYSLTEKGQEELKEVLLEAISIVHTFYGDYLQGLFPQINVFDLILRTLTDGLEPDDRIVFITRQLLSIHTMLISMILKTKPEVGVYLVKPHSLEVKLDSDSINVLNGSHDNIPLKNGYFNRLIVLDLPNKNILKESVIEWKRVIQDDGSLVVITPTILIQKQEDPLTIGDFVEKYEHQVIEEGEHVDPESFLTTLKDSFHNLKQMETIHITLITAQDKV